MSYRPYRRGRAFSTRVRIAAFWLVLGALHTAAGLREQGSVTYVITAIYALLPYDPVFNPRAATTSMIVWVSLLIALGVTSIITLGFETAFWIVVVYYGLSVAFAAGGIAWRNLRRADEPSRL